VGEFKAFVQATRYQTEAERDNHGALRWVKSKDDWEADAKCTWQSPGWAPDDGLPAVCLTRYDALAFCYWLGRKEGRAYRLPTEAEWELACLAGNASVEEARRNAAAITTEPADRSQKTADKSSAPADTHLQPDMPKNLWCWCADSFGRAPNGEKQAVDSPDSESNRWGVLRGMAWAAEEDRSGPLRLGLDVKVRRNDCGFRIVLEPGVR
jgi:formylglycine-generating enzyme required for sulfatase activity